MIQKKHSESMRERESDNDENNVLEHQHVISETCSKCGS
jgi:hypothetical protein